MFRQPGLLRPLSQSELSDGTLRYLLLIAALMTPRPPPLMVLNEPESSLHPDLLPPLGRLMQRYARDNQLWVVSHATELHKVLGRGAGSQPHPPRQGTRTNPRARPGPARHPRVEVARPLAQALTSITHHRWPSIRYDAGNDGAKTVSQLTTCELNDALAGLFAAWVRDLDLTVLTAVGSEVKLNMVPHERLVRVGGIISGQALMAAADTAMVLAVFAAHDEVVTCATVDMNSSFLKPATNVDLFITASVVRKGRTIVFARAEIVSSLDDKPVLAATGTYALP